MMKFCKLSALVLFCMSITLYAPLQVFVCWFQSSEDLQSSLYVLILNHDILQLVGQRWWLIHYSMHFRVQHRSSWWVSKMFSLLLLLWPASISGKRWTLPLECCFRDIRKKSTSCLSPPSASSVVLYPAMMFVLLFFCRLFLYLVSHKESTSTSLLWAVSVSFPPPVRQLTLEGLCCATPDRRYCVIVPLFPHSLQLQSSHSPHCCKYSGDGNMLHTDFMKKLWTGLSSQLAHVNLYSGKFHFIQVPYFPSSVALILWSSYFALHPCLNHIAPFRREYGQWKG